MIQPYFSNPDDDDDDGDDGEDEFSGLMNWPPSRGPDPHLPRSTYLPNLKRDPSFKPIREQKNIKGATGEWISPYRVSMLRSLNLEQADNLIHIAATKQQGRIIDRWDFEWRGKKFPSFFVDFKEIVTWKGVKVLDKPYRLIINPMTIKNVYTHPKTGKVRKTQERGQTSHGYFFYAVAKELEKIYAGLDLIEDFQDLYFQKVQVRKTGEVKIEFLMHQSPKQVNLIPPNVIREEFESSGPVAERLPEPKVSRADARKLRACGLALYPVESSRWDAFYQISQIATLNLLQAHELLTVNLTTKEAVTQGHPLFSKLQDRERRVQKDELRIDELVGEEAEDEGPENEFLQELRAATQEIAGEEDLEPEEEKHLSEEVRFYCPFCGAKNKGQTFSYQQLSNDAREVTCQKCEKEWLEPLAEIYYRHYQAKVLDNWSKCRGDDAPMIILDIDYPLQKVVRLTIPPATFTTDLGTYKMMSPGYLMWILAKEYQRIYQHHEEYGIWGHGIYDLYLEVLSVEPNGQCHLFIGS